MAARARRIQVKLGRSHTSLWLEQPETELLKAEDVLRWLRNPLATDARQGGARDLAAALRAATGLNPQVLEMVMPGARFWLLPGRGLRVEAGSTSDVWQLDVRLPPPAGWWDRFRSYLQRVTDEHRLIQTRCRHSLTEIWLDGRPLGGYTQPALLEFVLTGPDVGQTDALRVEAPPGWLRRQAELDRPQLKLLGASLERPPEAGRLKLAVFRIAPDLAGNSQLILVRQGVECSPVAVELGCPGARVWLAAPGLAVDLSEFSPVQDERFELVLSVLRRRLRLALLEVAPLLRQSPPALRRRLLAALPYLRERRPPQWTPSQAAKNDFAYEKKFNREPNRPEPAKPRDPGVTKPRRRRG